MIIRTCLFLILMSSLAVSGFAQDALSVSPSGDVGIGTTAPSEKLDVDGNIKASGRIMDATGFVMPVGSIMPYGGTTAPDGWLMCDGSAVSRTTYADLFTVVGTAFGEGDGVTTFNLPDLRGRFLRGSDAGAGRDPDAGSRTAMVAGGNVGGAVGSVQADAFQGHRHPVPQYYKSGTSGYDTSQGYDSVGGTGNCIHIQSEIYVSGRRQYYTKSPRTDGTNGTPRTASETRPINAYVSFIIKS